MSSGESRANRLLDLARSPATTAAGDDAAVFVWRHVAARWGDYLSLTKPRVAVLLLLTALVGMVLATEGALSLSRVGFTLLGGYLAAGGAGALNCYLDRDLDGRMTRTAHRALPAGRLTPLSALVWGLSLGLTSGLVLWFGTHPLAALLTLLASAHYVIVYTLWLKRRSPQNVVVGGAAGAVPPLVGWAAATGALSPTAWLLAAIIFCWTPAHFWALALMRREEYERAGVPMLPVVRGQAATRRQISVYVILTLLLTALPVIGGTWGALYAIGAAAVNSVLLYRLLRMCAGSDSRATRRFYVFTLIYLVVLFSLILLDKVLPL